MAAIPPIKCTKEKLACIRCMSLGLCCIYSPSLRAGKIRQLWRDGEKDPSRNEFDIAGLHWGHGSTRPETSLRNNDLGDLLFVSGQDDFKSLEDFQESCKAIWQDATIDPSACLPDDRSEPLLDSDSALLGSANPGNSSFLTSPSSSINLSSFLHDEVDLSGLMPRAMDGFGGVRIN